LSEATEFVIGSKVSCRDGICGELRRVVVDPVARAITHLAVEPEHAKGEGRLVPIDFVVSAGDEIQLRCTRAQFEVLEEADETQLLSGAPGDYGYGQRDILSLPYYGLGMSGMGSVGGVGRAGVVDIGRTIHREEETFDRVPVGEVEVRRGEHVHATDGNIGRVRGLVIDPRDHHVTHFLLDEGHLWGAKTVAIPIGSVSCVEDGVRLNLSKDQVRDLPAIDVEHRP
jgi:sporulation protein YlmC with PRC-barrel domain